MNDAETQLREQLTTTFGRADFPVSDPFELIPVLPEGPATKFKAGNFVLPAIALGTEYNEYQEFPYETVDALVNDIIAGLRAEGEL